MSSFKYSAILLFALALPLCCRAAVADAGANTVTAGTRDPEVVARLLKTDLASVQAATRLDLTERLTWVVLRVSRACACSPAQVMRERRTRSWGEVAKLHGLAWAALMDELDGLMAAAGWTWAAPSLTQIRRSASNDPDKLDSGGQR